jgi:hypothetical protein
VGTRWTAAAAGGVGGAAETMGSGGNGGGDGRHQHLGNGGGGGRHQHLVTSSALHGACEAVGWARQQHVVGPVEDGGASGFL